MSDNPEEHVMKSVCIQAILSAFIMTAYAQRAEFLPYGVELKQGSTSALIMPFGFVPNFAKDGIPPDELRMYSVGVTLSSGDPLVHEYQVTATVRTDDGKDHQFNESVPTGGPAVMIYNGRHAPVGVSVLKIIAVHADQVTTFRPGQ